MKVENHIHILSLHFVHYNFCRIHKNLKVIPAIQALLRDTAQEIEFIVELMEQAMSASAKRKPRKMQNLKLRHYRNFPFSPEDYYHVYNKPGKNGEISLSNNRV